MAHDPITAGLGLVDTFINKFVKDKDLAAKLSAEARSEEFQGDLSLLTGQMAVNTVEAGHKSVFVAGWRPFIGWVCGIALAYNFILYPFLKFILSIIVFYGETAGFPVIPELNTAELMTVLMGMLGLGTLRTMEKQKGVARES